MTSDPDINTQEIIQFKRDAKRKYGPSNEWPDFVRERYEQMKRENAELRYEAA